MSYYGGGGQNGGSGRGGTNPQTALLSGPPQHQHQLFVNPNQIQFSTATQNFTFPQGDNSQGQLQLNTGGAPLLLQPPVNFVTDQLGLGQLITQAAAQSQQNLQNIMNLGSVLNPSIQIQDQQSQGGPQQSKQRVFTGTVTKIHDNFGFIDEEVFFQMGVVKGPVLPKEGDRVLVEADFNPSMPFKWNATRVQIVNMGGGLSSNSHNNHNQQSHQNQQQSTYQQQMINFPTSMASGQKAHPVPPPPTISNMNSRSQQSVSIVSNPHSIYSSGPPRTTSHLLPEPHSNRRPHPSQHLAPEPPQISAPPSANLPSLLLMDRDRRESSRERDRKDRETDRARERSKERQRERERERRERSRERERERSRSRSRERRRRSPSPNLKKRSSREKKDLLDREKDKGRITRDRSPLVAVKPVVDRAKRSRSRETVKSSDSKTVDRTRSVTPRRKNISKPPPRYSVEVPKFTLDTMELSIMEMRRRYPNLYVPSDFFLVKATWMETFPLYNPFEIGKPSPVHIFGRHVNRTLVQEVQGVSDPLKDVTLEASDSSCTFKVKVMILSSGSIAQIYKKSGCSTETSSEDKESFHPLQRLLSFVVGVKSGKQEVMGLGGAWSPSLDGLNPQSDPQVLINTGIRTVKALAGLDLSRCSRWYRFMELYYRRSNGNLETTVYFLPDLSTCVPDEMDWASIKNAHRIALYGKKTTGSSSRSKSKKEGKSETVQEEGGKGLEQPLKEDENHPEEDVDISRMEVIDECNGDEQESVEETPIPQQEVVEEEPSKLDNSFDIYEDIVEGAGETRLPNKDEPLVANTNEESPRGTHFSLVEPKNLNVAKLREELSVRNLSTKGLKSQLTIRLAKALKEEQEIESKISEEQEEPPLIGLVDPSTILESVQEESEKVEGKMEEGEIHEDEQEQGISVIKDGMSSEEKGIWERRYALPKSPKILMYPSTTVKGGIFDCSSMTLSSLRDYRIVDRKEESFEVSLFSELFYEMLNRDFAFRIYQEIVKNGAKESQKDDEEKGQSKEQPPSSKKRKISTTTAVVSTDSTDKAPVLQPFLLLSFLFFDQTQCGYITEVDLEEICAALGLGLTRSQIRKKIQKVVTKGSLHYRKWTESEEGAVKENHFETIKSLSQGNKALLPVFTYSIFDGCSSKVPNGLQEDLQPVLVQLDGDLVDVRKMKDDLHAAEKEGLRAEANSNVLKNSLNEAKNHVSELKKSTETLKEDLSKTKESLKKLESSDKSNKEDLEVFRRASERFIERVKDIVKVSPKEGKVKEEEGSSNN